MLYYINISKTEKKNRQRKVMIWNVHFFITYITFKKQFLECWYVGKNSTTYASEKFELYSYFSLFL